MAELLLNSSTSHEDFHAFRAALRDHAEAAGDAAGLLYTRELLRRLQELHPDESMRREACAVGADRFLGNVGCLLAENPQRQCGQDFERLNRDGIYDDYLNKAVVSGILIMGPTKDSC